MHHWFQPKRVYLDCAAGERPTMRALQAFSSASCAYGNPSSPHTEGRAAKEYLESARTSIARLAEVKPEGVIFTANATEANNLLIIGYLEALHQGGRPYADMHVLSLPSSHASVTEAVKELARRGVHTEEVSVLGGHLNLENLAQQLRDTTVLIVLDAVCGETGIRFPVRDVRRVLLRRYAGSVVTPHLHVDAVQLPSIAPYELTRLGADSLSLDAQKVGGVRGIGALVLAHTTHLCAQTFGGSQERGLRAGTQASALAHAFATALMDTHTEREAFLARSKQLRTLLIDACGEIQDVIVHEGKEQAPHIVNLSLLGRDTDYLVALLDTAGFAVSTKSACESDKEGSRAILAYTEDTEQAAATLRVSWGREVSTSDMRRFARALVASVEFLDSAGILKT